VSSFKILHNKDLCRSSIIVKIDGLDMWLGWRRQGMCAEFWWGNLMRVGHIED
jgi:hypothetical protein